MDLRLMLLLSVITYTVLSDQCNKYNSNALKKGQYLPNLSFKQFKDSSLYSCAAACYSYTICRSFNLNQRTRACFLNVEDITCPDRDLVQNASFIYSSITDWDKGIAGPCELNECATLSQRCHVTRNRSVFCGNSLKEDTDYTVEFILYKTETTWNEAKEYCRERCGRLAVVNTAQKNGQVAKLMAENDIEIVWLGATDWETEGQWMWVNGEEMDYNDWSEAGGLNQPNNWPIGTNEENGQEGEDCLTRKSSVSPGWYDYSCSKSYSFMCEHVHI